MKKRRWTRRRTWALVALSPFLLLALAGAVHKYRATRALDQHLAAIQAQGYPVTLAEVNAYYPEPPEGQNAADHYLKAFEVLSPWEAYCPPDMTERLNELHWPVNVATLPDEEREVVLAWIDGNAGAFEHLYAGAQHVECRYPLAFLPGEAPNVDHLTDIRLAVRLLCAEAFRFRAEGRPDDALKAVDAAFALVHSLRREPTVFSQMVRWVTHRMARETLASLIQSEAITPESAPWLASSIHEDWAYHGFARAMAAEGRRSVEWIRSSGRGMLVDSNTGKLQSLPIGLAQLYKYCGIAEAEALHLSENVQVLVEAWESPLPQRPAAIVTAQSMADSPPGLFVTSASLLGGLASLARDEVYELDMAIDLRSASAIMAIERYRAESGALPEQMRDLVPAYLPNLPEDPATGAPLLYRLFEKGYVVYSVGNDGVDNGGPNSWQVGASASFGSDDRGFRVGAE